MKVRQHRHSGGALPLVLLVLVLGLGGLGYNYKRNLDLERQQPRPYRAYSDANLKGLITAYEHEVDRLQAQPLRSTKGTRPHGDLLGDRIRSYQRVHAAGQANRLRASELAGQQGILKELERERETRDSLGSGWQLQMHRALHF